MKAWICSWTLLLIFATVATSYCGVQVLRLAYVVGEQAGERVRR